MNWTPNKLQRAILFAASVWSILAFAYLWGTEKQPAAAAGLLAVSIASAVAGLQNITVTESIWKRCLLAVVIILIGVVAWIIYSDAPRPHTYRVLGGVMPRSITRLYPFT